jgi:hypothetical protein
MARRLTEIEKKIYANQTLALEQSRVQAAARVIARARTELLNASGGPNATPDRVLKNLNAALAGFDKRIIDSLKLDGLIEAGYRQGRELLFEVGQGEEVALTPAVDLASLSVPVSVAVNEISGIGETLKTRIKETIEISLARGETESQTMDRLLTGIPGELRRSAPFRATRIQAERISRTVTNELVNEGKRLSYQHFAEANRHLVTMLEWVAVTDFRTSDICMALVGQKVQSGQAFNGGGWSGMAPPAHIMCRSTIIPFLAKREDTEDMVDSLAAADKAAADKAAADKAAADKAAADKAAADKAAADKAAAEKVKPKPKTFEEYLAGLAPADRDRMRKDETKIAKLANRQVGEGSTLEAPELEAAALKLVNKWKKAVTTSDLKLSQTTPVKVITESKALEKKSASFDMFGKTVRIYADRDSLGDLLGLPGPPNLSVSFSVDGQYEAKWGKPEEALKVSSEIKNRLTAMFAELQDGTVLSNSPVGGPLGKRAFIYSLQGFGPVSPEGSQYAIVKNGKAVPLNYVDFENISDGDKV